MKSFKFIFLSILIYFYIMNRVKNQITIETTLILTLIIMITILVIFVMFKILPTNQNSYSQVITLYETSVNSNSLTLYLSSKINDPQSLVLNYSPISNLYTYYTFNLINCNSISNTSSITPAYIFKSTSDCDFSIFQGTYVLNKATYNNDGTTTELNIKSSVIGYEPSNSVTFSTISVSPSILPHGGSTTATLETNMANSIYSLSLGKYTIRQCTGISTSKQCSFVLNSSIGVYNINSFYILNAYIYNTTENEETNTSIYVS